MTKTLLTRLEKFSQKNLSSITQPLFSIARIDNLQPINQELQAVLITSSAAVFALEKLAIKKDVLVLAVGKKTADEVKKLGYKNVLFANNSAASLLDLALNNVKNKDLIIYLAGEKITLDLAEKLSKQNFNAQKIVVYKTIEIEKFSGTTIDEIRIGNVGEVWIYSKNSLRIFYKLAQKHNLLECLGEIKILCLSQEIAELAREIGFLKTGIIKG
jgi:uroporphyrinogen-III synthase